MNDPVIYHMCSKKHYEDNVVNGIYMADTSSGFIHLSTGAEVAETLRVWFKGVAGLVLLSCVTDKLTAEGGELKWEWVEPRNAHFPHLFASGIPTQAVTQVVDIPWDEESKTHRLPSNLA